MKKTLIWITVGGLAVAGTAYILIKQNKKKIGSVEPSNVSKASDVNLNQDVTIKNTVIPSNTVILPTTYLDISNLSSKEQEDLKKAQELAYTITKMSLSSTLRKVLKNVIAEKTNQLTSLGYAIQPNGGVRKI